MAEEALQDRRVRRTRLAIFDAFRDLVLTRRYDDVSVADIIEAANIGRSTFYDHFHGKDDVLLTSIEPLFDVIADAAAGKGERERVAFVISHFWEQRSFGRIVLGPDLYFKFVRKLAAMIEARLDHAGDPKEIIAISAASSRLGLLRAWLSGEVKSDTAAMTDIFMEPLV